MNRYIPRWLLCCCVCCIVTCAGRVWGQEAAAQSDWAQKPLKFQAQKASLSEVIRRLQPLLRRGILVQGDSLTHQADVAIEGTQRDVLNCVAETFDYTWSLSKSGIVLMRKRFHNPQERPQITVAEMRQMAQSMLRLLDQLPYSLASEADTPMYQSLTRSFTETQAQALAEGSRLPLRDMPAEQRKLLCQMAYYRHYSDARLNCERFLANLEGMRTGYLHVYFLAGRAPANIPVPPQRWLAYTIAAGAQSGSVLFELSDPKSKP